MGALKEILDQIGRLFKWWTTVTPWEQAVRVRLGKHTKVLCAGVHLRIPVIDQYYVQSVRKRFATVPTQTITTKDGITLTVSGAVGYVIKDIFKLYNTLQHPQDALESETMGKIGRYIANHDYSECTPSIITEHLNEVMNLQDYGLGDTEIYITDFAAAKTYRLINGSPKDWITGDNLNTENYLV